MKRCKHYLIFLLAGALLLLPVTSHYAYAISWDDIKKNISSFFSENTLQRVIPGALITLGIGGALYYWWTTRKGGGPSVQKKESSEEKSSEEESSEKLVVPSLKQFQVYSQFNRDPYGGGDASCGYQTLLRGMQLVRVKSEGESDASIEKTLMDPFPIEVYFGQNGEWRKQIIARRKDQEFKKALDKKFISVLVQNCDDKVIASYGLQAYEPIIAAIASKKLSGDKARDLYKSSFGFLEDIMLLISKQPEAYMQYDFTDEAIQNYLAKSLEQLKNASTEALIEILQKPEMINQCFDLEKMRKEFLSKDFVLSLSGLIEELNARSDLEERFRGDWLDKEEIEYLWEDKKYDIVPQRISCYLNVIDDFSLLGEKDVDPTTSFIVKEIKPSLNKNKVLFVIFALGTMRQSRIELVISHGHWYPLVMYQNQKGERAYYIMDSASENNYNRIKDENAWEIINFIERTARSI